MKIFRKEWRRARLGFSLVEAALSVSLLSVGFLSMAPMLGLGLQSARQARDHQVAAQIAETLADQVREGVAPAGSASYDDQGSPCPSGSACYRATTTETALPGNCTRLTIEITPVAASTRPLDYAVVVPSP